MGDVDLSDLDDEFSGSEAPNRKGGVDYESGDDVPDGTYSTRVDRVEVRQSQAGNRYLSWGLEITEGEFKGCGLWKRSMLQTAKNMGWLKADLEICGIVLGKLSELSGRLEELLDKRIKVRLKRNGEFTDVYFVRLIGHSGTPSEKPDHTVVRDKNGKVLF